jgi:hypothetical protein
MTGKPRKRRRSCTDSRWPDVAMIIMRIFVQVSKILANLLGHAGLPGGCAARS